MWAVTVYINHKTKINTQKHNYNDGDSEAQKSWANNKSARKKFLLWVAVDQLQRSSAFSAPMCVSKVIFICFWANL